MKTRSARIEWIGDLQDGGGQVSTQSGALADTPFGFGSRFLDEPGTNPEELLSAAHASCFTTHLALLLGQNGTPPEDLRIASTIHLTRIAEDRVAITEATLEIKARIAGMPSEDFDRIVSEAASDCPIARILDIETKVKAALL